MDSIWHSHTESAKQVSRDEDSVPAPFVKGSLALRWRECYGAVRPVGSTTLRSAREPWAVTPPDWSRDAW